MDNESKDFVTHTVFRFSQFGHKMMLSDKQVQWLNSLRYRLMLDKEGRLIEDNIIISRQIVEEWLKYLNEVDNVYSLPDGMGWSYCLSCGSSFSSPHKNSCKVSKLVKSMENILR
ncbi:MAG TPA: hypothetical protein ENI76_06860 [Ignavibacteria bacterium]|nr:hypothetical protein [Ignavibacteria bacterium]